MRLTDANGRKWVLVPTDGHWDMTKAALALIKSTGVNPGDLTVGGLAAAIENAIAAAPEFEGSISEHDETIRQLRAQLDEYERAPTVAWLATQQQHNPSQCVVTTKLDGWDHAELIARPTRKGE